MSLADSLYQFDGNLLIGIQHTLNADWLTPIMKGITFLGEDGWLPIAFCFVLVLFRRTRKLGLLCSFSILFSFILCNFVLKPSIDRMRPWEVFDAVKPLIPDPGDASFPSGHATNCMSTAFAFWLNTKAHKVDGIKTRDKGPSIGWNCEGADRQKLHRWSIFAVVLAGLIGLSRLYLGMHFPSDVVIGMLIGMTCAMIVYKINMKIESQNGIIKTR